MTKDTEKQIMPALQEIIRQFNETLGSHIERLIGTRQGIKGLPMNLTNISCLVLLSARETEIESFPYLPPDRYTDEKIEEELANIGIEPGDDLATGIQGMIDNHYIEKKDDGRFFAKKPAITMVQLIDRLFPRTPGLNLLAYLD